MNLNKTFIPILYYFLFLLVLFFFSLYFQLLPISLAITRTTNVYKFYSVIRGGKRGGAHCFYNRTRRSGFDFVCRCNTPLMDHR